MTTALTPAPSAPLTELDNQTDELIETWLFGRSKHTQRSYRADAARFLAFSGKPLHLVTLSDLQAYAGTLTGLSDALRNRLLSAIKSLLSFGHKLGILPVNAGAPLKLLGQKDTLAERIMPEGDVHLMINLEKNPRNRTILRLLYAAGVRVSELCGLTWRDVQPRDDAGQVTVFGKGKKTRAILLSVVTWEELIKLRQGADSQEPVFRSRKGGGPLDTSTVFRIVQAAAREAKIEENVSPHWMRHAHASHALDRGAPISLVQATLGHSSVATTGRYLHARPNDSSARYLGV